MAAPAIGKRRRWAPPVTAKVDWSHPLATGLQFLWFASSPDVDRAGGAVLSTSGGMPAAASAWGFARTPVVGGNGFASFTSAGLTASTPLTVVAVGTFTGSGGGGHRRVLTIPADQTAVDTPQVSLDAPDNNGFAAVNIGGPPYNTAITDPTLMPQGPYVLVATWSGGGSSTAGLVSLYRAGGLVASTSATSGVQVQGSIEVGRYNANYAQNADNPLVMVAVYGRCMTSGEVASITADPFCFMRW